MAGGVTLYTLEERAGDTVPMAISMHGGSRASYTAECKSRTEGGGSTATTGCGSLSCEPFWGEARLSSTLSIAAGPEGGKDHEGQASCFYGSVMLTRARQNPRPTRQRGSNGTKRLQDDGRRARVARHGFGRPIYLYTIGSQPWTLGPGSFANHHIGYTLLRTYSVDYRRAGDGAIFLLPTLDS
ncbi:uncharacterized protein EI97DRAFT_440615 [Westerdykella ornata]|uniref:Uncharacterized protein n=1 Tax=Westerdykella ornata TaxID=318751 RepID=A0A6A6JRG0_WESOR|nr:uncharacterized protein EI97DRAFT_440615 [Westerdykella ornata]KAF2279152.1 hypothetical protein EI97DRAFT_440615 [Westerdykella ornata]